MIKSIVLLIGLCGIVGLDAVALTGGTTTTCDVGEQEKVRGLCPDGKTSSKCADYCKKKFGGELIAAQCTHERPTKKRECICRLKCCNQGCWGDPHCWTCDGTKFGYQGLKKYYVLKSLANYPTFPEFEIRQINRPWQNGPMSILDVSEFYIKDWKITAVIKTPNVVGGKYFLQVNDKNETIPYTFKKFDDNRELFMTITFGDAKQTQVVVKTSFGIKIVYTTQTSGAHVYSDISIDTPRHPEIKGKIGGILGNWDDNPKNDGTGADGQVYPLEEGFSWKFGDSWIVPGGRTPTAECVIKEKEKKAEDFKNKVDKTIKAQAEQLCEKVLNNPELKKCAKDINRALPSIHNCVLDQLFLESAKDRNLYIKDLIRSFARTCRRRNKKKGHRSSSSSESVSSSSSSSSSSESGSGSGSGDKDADRPKKPKAPKPQKPQKQQKEQKPHAQKPKPNKQKNEKPGRHHTKPKTEQPGHPKPAKPAGGAGGKPGGHHAPAPAHQPGAAPGGGGACGTPTNLVTLYRLYKPSSDDHFYTTNHAEAMNAAQKLGYVMEGSPGRVSPGPSANLIPVHRLYKPGAKDDHFYTQNEGEAVNAATRLGYVREGVAFYCPPAHAANSCGASAPFHRYWRGTDHFYTTNQAEGTNNVVRVGGSYEGVLCHIWPNAARG